MMKERLEIGGGSVIGHYHSRNGRNNQDSYGWVMTDDYLIGVVCDGCGSGTHSEVGAQWGVKAIISVLIRALSNNKNYLINKSKDSEREFWTNVQEDFLQRLREMVGHLDPDLTLNKMLVQEYGLFTIVGGVITSELVVIFSWGDGVIILNNVRTELGPFPNNSPPYIGYELLKPGRSEFRVNSLAFSEFDSLLLGTDGVMELINNSHKNLPGKRELVGEISQFWHKDLYFKNPDQIRRRLTLINRENTQIDWSTQQVIKQGGWLQDDTTFIVIRKKS